MKRENKEQRNQVSTAGFQRRDRSQSQGRTHNKSQHSLKNANIVSKDDWDKMTPEQQSKVREQRAKQTSTVKNSNSNEQSKTKYVGSNEFERKLNEETPKRKGAIQSDLVKEIEGFDQEIDFLWKIIKFVVTMMEISVCFSGALDPLLLTLLFSLAALTV